MTILTMPFAAYLHNIFGFPNDIQKAAILHFTERAQSIEDYTLTTHLDNTILNFFGSIDDLHKYGLSKYYNLLKEEVVENNLIGLFLYGADKSKDNKHYQTYNTNQGSTINLTRHSVCYILIKEYMEEEEVDDLCRKTPNFDQYYTSVTMENQSNNSSTLSDQQKSNIN